MNKINIICWNCRGLSGNAPIDRIRNMIRTYKPAVVCLVESRANQERVERFVARFSRSWNWAAITSEGYSGGIIVLWRRQLGSVTPIARSRLALHLVITPGLLPSWILTVVYNGQRIGVQKHLWKELFGMSSINIPWVILGDFNSITNASEHKGGPYYHYARKAKLFMDFISYNSLLDIGISGPSFLGAMVRWVKRDAGRVWTGVWSMLIGPASLTCKFSTIFQGCPLIILLCS